MGLEQLARLGVAVDDLRDVDVTVLPIPEQLAAAEAIETVLRKLRAVQGTLLYEVACQPPQAVGDKPPNAIATKLRISPKEAKRRLADAGLVADRTTLTGTPLPPVLAHAAPLWHAGSLDPEHLHVIATCLAGLPVGTAFTDIERVERELSAYAVDFRPDQLKQLGDRMVALINPDGNYTEKDRARRRGVSIGRQQADGMSPISGWLTPELRATLDAVFGKLAAPGKCNPDDQSPCVDGDPEPVLAERDTRTAAQRNHDALLAMGRSVLASGELGSHRGLPVTVVVTTTLQALESAAGQAVTGSGTLLPISDLIRMATHAHHYLAVFDEHTGEELYLGRTRRLASPGQRIMLHANYVGCTFPGCTVPGYLCEADHIDEFADHGPTDIDNLHFPCGAHHRLKSRGGWKVRRRQDGRVEWIPPPQLEIPGGVNDYHHPDRLLPGRE